MKINSRKSHGNDDVSANIDDHTIISENKNELLGIILDSKLFCRSHNNLNKKSSQKPNALARIAPLLCLEKRISYESIYNISMSIFHSRGLNNKINFLNQRALRIT